MLFFFFSEEIFLGFQNNNTVCREVMDQVGNCMEIPILFLESIFKRSEWLNLKVTNNSSIKPIMKPFTHFKKNSGLRPVKCYLVAGGRRAG